MASIRSVGHSRRESAVALPVPLLLPVSFLPCPKSYLLCAGSIFKIASSALGLLVISFDHFLYADFQVQMEVSILSAKLYLGVVKKILSILLLAVTTTPGFSQDVPTPKSVPDVAAGRSIHQMFEDDQSEVPANMPDGVAPITYEEFSRRRQLRCARIRVLLDSGVTISARDFHDAAFLFQHGETADDYLMAHILAVEAVIRGDEPSKWIAASTLDRYLQIIHRPQVFGTQYSRDEKVLAQIQDKKNIFQGRSQDPFDDKFLPNSVRLDYCVPDVAQQKKNLASLNAGVYPDATMTAPGCKR